MKICEFCWQQKQKHMDCYYYHLLPTFIMEGNVTLEVSKSKDELLFPFKFTDATLFPWIQVKKF